MPIDLQTYLPNGPYLLSELEIRDKVEAGKIGVYGLGKPDEWGIFRVKYVGRSDDDLQDRLLKWLKSGYSHFRFGYCETSEEAYRNECRLYHGLNNLDNEKHPDKPNGSDVQCPICWR